MRWFRSNPLFGGWLALFALAVQLTVSFAHIHPEDLNSVIGIGAAHRAWAVQQARDVAGLPATPSGDHGNGLPHESCPICVAIQLAGNAVIATPPALSAPTTFESVQLSPIHEFDLELVRYFSFLTRAPPAV